MALRCNSPLAVHPRERESGETIRRWRNWGEFCYHASVFYQDVKFLDDYYDQQYKSELLNPLLPIRLCVCGMNNMVLISVENFFK